MTHIALGFTGTQAGMTGDQAATVIKLLNMHKPREVHHGGCVGADEQFHWLVTWFFPEAIIHIWPADTGPMRAELRADLIHSVTPDPLKRNDLLVEHSDVIIATPRQAVEIRRSGTWSTIRRARNASVKHHVVIPGGGYYTD